MTGHEEEATGNDDAEHPITLLEKIATGIAALLVAFLLAVLVWDAAHPDTSPRFSVDVDSVSLDGPVYRVPATIHNTGDKSAKSVVVHVELVGASKDSAVAETDITIDWLPGKSSRDVVAVLSPGKSGGPLRARAEARGYVVP